MTHLGRHPQVVCPNFLKAAVYYLGLAVHVCWLPEGGTCVPNVDDPGRLAVHNSLMRGHFNRPGAYVSGALNANTHS